MIHFRLSFSTLTFALVKTSHVYYITHYHAKRVIQESNKKKQQNKRIDEIKGYIENQ